MYKRELLLSYAGIHTFFRAPQRDFEDLRPGDVAVVGIPWDGTCQTRPGCRYGPLAIRQTSSHLYYYMGTSVTTELVDLATGNVIKGSHRQKLVDLGDLNLYPGDIARTSESISAGVAEIVRRGAFPVILGGDHYISYPCFNGVTTALREKRAQIRLGYIQLDAHFDLGDENPLWGKFHHGSNARRISEVGNISPENMVWVGIRGYARKEQIDWVRAKGASYITAYEIARRGIKEVMAQAIETASRGTDGIYITVDIDIVDSSLAPGTGAIAFGGITQMQLLEGIEMLKQVQAVAFDLVELAPNLDPSGITERLATQAILNYIVPRIFV